MNISNLNGNILKDYNKVDSFNNFYNILPPNIDRTSSIQTSKVFYTFLITKTSNNILSILPNLGKKEESLYIIEITSSTGITDEDILDFEFDENYIYILTNYKIIAKKYTYNEIEDTLVIESSNYFSLTNSSYNIENIKLNNNGTLLKIQDNFLVFNKYNKLEIINLNDTTKSIKEYSDSSNKYFMDFNIYSYNDEIYINYSLLNDPDLYIIKLNSTLNLTTINSSLIKTNFEIVTDNPTIEDTLNFLKKTTLEKNELKEFNKDDTNNYSPISDLYGNITNSIYFNNKIYFYTGNCNLYCYDISTKLTTLFFKLDGKIIDINANNEAILINTLNKQVYYIKENKEYEIIEVEENAVSTYINNVLIMLELKNNRVLFYKLNNLPDMYPNYINIEDYSYDDQYGIYLNMNLQLRNYYNTINNDKLTLDLQYRNNQLNNIPFPEMDMNKNIYLKLDDSNILKEPVWYFNTFKPYYKINNTTKNYTISNFGTDTGDEDIISKLFIKDFYYLGGKLYFRIKYIFDGSFFLNIKINENDNIVVGKIKDDTLDLNNKLSKVKEVINSANNYFIDKDNIYKQFEWVYLPIDLDLNGIDDQLKIDIQIYNRDSSNIFQPIDSNNGGFKSFNVDVRKASYDEILYTTSDGDIKLLEKKYIRMDNLPKEIFLDKNFDLVEENSQDISECIIDKNQLINNMPNYETSRGNLNLTKTTPVTHKDHFNMSNIYINGKKLYKENYTQKDLFNGLLETLVPVRNLNQILSEEDLKAFEEGNLNKGYNVLVEILAKKLIGNEQIISRFKVYSLEEKLEVITDRGINKTMKSYDLGVPTKVMIDEDGNEVIIEEAPYNQVILQVYDTTISNDIEPNNIRLYVKTTGEEFVRRINPSYYTITLDREYSFINIKSVGTDIFEVGNEIILMTDGVSDNLNMFNDLSNSPNDIEAIPLLNINNDTNELFQLPVDKASDIEVIIDGYTLYPEVDYSLINKEGSIENIPPLLVFRRKLKKTSKVELNLLGESSGYVKYFKCSARDEDGNKTYNIFTMDDDNMLFIPNKFSIYVNNLRYPNKDIKILNTKTIEIGSNNLLLNSKTLNKDNYGFFDNILMSNENDVLINENKILTE